MAINKATKSPDELADIAWALVEEAMTQGTITIIGPDGIVPEKLSLDQKLDIIKWLTQVKLKQKHAVESPEDFRPANTKGDDEDEA